MPIAKVGDINIEYYVEGTGPPLLMIMGWMGSAGFWGEAFLERLRPHFQTIRISNRGTGLTDKPSGDYDIRLMAEDAAGLLRELGVERAHVLGISMGGMIAQELVLNHAQVVQGLALGCTTCGFAHGVLPSSEIVTAAGQAGNVSPRPRAAVPPSDRYARISGESRGRVLGVADYDMVCGPNTVGHYKAALRGDPGVRYVRAAFPYRGANAYHPRR